MFGIDFEVWVFTHFRLWLIGALAITIGVLELWKSRLPEAQRSRSKTLKAFNWVFAGLVFISMEVLAPYIEIITFRAWLRLALLVVVVSEFGYHSNVLPDVVGFIKNKGSTTVRKLGRGRSAKLPL